METPSPSAAASPGPTLYDRGSMPGNESDDLALVRRVAHGDGAAFAALYDRYAPQAFGLLRRMLRRHAEAEELLQEAFLQVWRDADRYQPHGASPRGWILMIARSRAIDRLRSSAARERREAAVVENDPPSPAGVGPSGPERVEERERRTRVAAALASLPPEQREAIECAFFEGLTHREAAARLGAPLGTVKSRILLGMRKLREALEPA
jgi:RNA polymerase sigma-70 factor (ECF subfamily)